MRDCLKMISTRNARISAAALAISGAIGAVAAEDDPAIAYGKHLAGECTSCHRLEASSGAIPSITGRPTQEFIELLLSYREGRRTNAVMVSVAQSLDDKQMAALAAYFGSLPSAETLP